MAILIPLFDLYNTGYMLTQKTIRKIQITLDILTRDFMQEIGTQLLKVQMNNKKRDQILITARSRYYS